MNAPAIDALELQAWFDDELELSRRLALEQRLQEDPSLRARAEALRQARAELRLAATYHLAPEALQQRVAALAAPAQTAGARDAPPARGRAVAQTAWAWAWRPALAGAFATACLALGGQWLWQRQVEQRQLVDHVVASHVRATLGEHLVDVASSDRHTVKPWLASRLDFSPPVQELPVPGSQFLGARIDFLAGRPVAALVYRQGNHVVTDYSWPAAGADSAAAVTSERGFRIAHWQRHGLAHWVISDVGSEGFAAVVQALVQAGSEN